MANYNTLKNAVQEVIKTNGNNEITGQVLQDSLVAMINSLGAGYQFIGVATPATNPGTPDQRVFYIASSGTYPNFGPAIIPSGNLAVFYYDTSWHYDLCEITAKFGSGEVVNDVNIVNDPSIGGANNVLGANGGKVLKGLIDDIKEIINSGFVFMGVATPATTNPTNRELRPAWIAYEAGTYTDLNGYVVNDGEIVVITRYTNAIDLQVWNKVVIFTAPGIAIDDVPTPHSNNLVKSGGVYSQLNQLDQELGQYKHNTVSTEVGVTYYNTIEINIPKNRKFVIGISSESGILSNDLIGEIRAYYTNSDYHTLAASISCIDYNQEFIVNFDIVKITITRGSTGVLLSGDITLEVSSWRSYSKTETDEFLSDVNDEIDLINIETQKIKINQHTLNPTFLSCNKTSIPQEILFDSDFGIYKESFGYLPNKQITDYWTLIGGNTYYVDPATGSDSNPGTSSSPFKWLRKAVDTATDGDTIIVKSGLFTRDRVSLSSFNKNLRIIGDGNVYLIGGDNGSYLSFSSVGDNTYSASRSSVYDVFDFDTGVPVRLTKVESIADCKLTQNSWYTDNTTLYVHCHDNRTPDGNLIALLTATANSVVVDKIVYMQNIHFFGGTSSLQINKESTLLANCCWFENAHENGLRALGSNSYLFGCVARNNGKDGFNYHISSDNTTISKTVEVSCNGYNNGSDADDNNNGSTLHDGCKGVRLNCCYWNNEGPNLADVNSNTASYNIGCRCSFSRANSDTRKIDYHADGGAVIYLIDCSSSDSLVSLKISNGSEIVSSNTVYTGSKNVDETSQYVPL